MNVLGGDEAPIAVAVDGLEDRIAGAQVAEMLSQHVNVVAIVVQRRRPRLRGARARRRMPHHPLFRYPSARRIVVG
jgi:hypothetical protein